MADNGLDRFEAALGAIAKITSEDRDLVGARCPKCTASDFVKVSDLRADALVRIEEDAGSAAVRRDGGMTNIEIVEQFPPPRRKSAVVRVLAVAIPLAAICLYVYRRFGDRIGQTAIAASALVTVVVLLTSLRRLSDD